MKGTILQKRNRKGFTLVELVIVVAVLAIIAGIAIPTVHNVIDNANKAADDSNAQSIELAIKTAQSELAANNTNPSDAIAKLQSPPDGKSTLNFLLKTYGVNLSLTGLKQSTAHYYFDSTSGKVSADTSKPDGYDLIAPEATYEISNSNLTIDPDGTPST